MLGLCSSTLLDTSVVAITATQFKDLKEGHSDVWFMSLLLANLWTVTKFFHLELGYIWCNCPAFVST
jgi:hypothetical protein